MSMSLMSVSASAIMSVSAACVVVVVATPVVEAPGTLSPRDRAKSGICAFACGHEDGY